jgi:DNA-binding MarR family transcriptional regulator
MNVEHASREGVATRDVGTGAADAPDADDLMAVLARLRRGVRARVRTDWPHPRLPDAHLELLLVVAGRPGLRVQDAAEALRLAPNTVSTLVNGPALAGLVERRRDPSDGRAVRLHPTGLAEERLAAWRSRRRTIVAGALATMPAADRDAIAGALPALGQLANLVERQS